MNPTPEEDSTVAQLEALVERARTGDRESVQQLQQVLNENEELWRRIGNLPGHVEAGFIGLVAGNNPLAAESIRRHADELRRSLLEAGESPSERLLVDEVIACWLAVKHSELRTAQDPADSQTNLARFHLKRVERTRGQFQKALRTLENFRRLQARNRTTQKASSPASPSTSDQTAPMETTDQPVSSQSDTNSPNDGDESLTFGFQPPPTIPIDGNKHKSREVSGENVET